MASGRNDDGHISCALYRRNAGFGHERWNTTRRERVLPLCLLVAVGAGMRQGQQRRRGSV